MNILLTGANGYIGRRLLPVLLEQGHHLFCLVRSPRRLEIPDHLADRVTILVGDLLKSKGLPKLPPIDAAYYLVHSMAHTDRDLEKLETDAARNFTQWIPSIKQIIYLSGLSRDEDLSPHLHSRRKVEVLLREGDSPVTVLRAGIIVGSGSASFEIMRDLVEKLPFMVAPKWVNSLCQPIGIYDILDYLVQVLGHSECLGQTFEIGGPDIMTYKEMLLRLAKVRGLRRKILTVPFLTPHLSAYWLYFVTATNYRLASRLVSSLKNNAICHESAILTIIPKHCLRFEEALERTFSKIGENAVVSSWKDALVLSELNPDLRSYIQVPSNGCLRDHKEVPFSCKRENVIDRVWAIGGETGWYAMNWAWKLRGLIDQLCMGAGLRRGRTHPTRLRPGDALDFWRVLLADKEHGRLLLYAEMKLPGEAWLEFHVKENSLHQTATFRPHGILGRLYWWSLLPLHTFVFRGMSKAIVKRAERLA